MSTTYHDCCTTLLLFVPLVLAMRRDVVVLICVILYRKSKPIRQITMAGLIICD